MGNRNMMAKRIKYIRQSKARPRSLRMNNGHMKGQSSVDRSKIPEEWLPLFDYRTRAMASNAEDFLETLFPSKGQLSYQRQQALFMSRNPMADKPLRTVLSDGKYVKAVMISDLGQTCFYFEEYHTIAKILRTSITYNNRDRAIDHFERGSLRWKESISISESS